MLTTKFNEKTAVVLNEKMPRRRVFGYPVWTCRSFVDILVVIAVFSDAKIRPS